VADDQRTFEVPAGRCLGVAPGVPTTDMARTAEHYRRLGFTFSTPGSPSVAEACFAIAERDGIGLHFALKPDHDPATTAIWVYIGVEDADVMSAEFDAAGAGQGRPVRDTDYKMREFAHIDPDGNLLLFGSPLRSRKDPAANEPPRGLEPGEQVAADLLRAVKQGDVDRLTQLLAADPELANAWINGCTPLQHFADAPGHRPNPAAVVTALVAAGADLNAHVRGAWHHETALHWAASNDDVELIDALLDAGADIEHPGSSIGGGPPIQSALGYAQWAAVRRLWERGAKAGLSHMAVLGLTDQLSSLVEASDRDATSMAFWNACRAGQLASAQYLLAHGADRDWQAPWDGSTALDAATAKNQHEMAAWLRSR
jgi:ankyrin repeat protein/predicted enzyme related to lactoylglutathione lyase